MVENKQFEVVLDEDSDILEDEELEEDELASDY